MTVNSPNPWWSKDTIAVVTGANKGIGYEIVRALARQGMTVVLTARDESRGQAAVKILKAEGLESIRFHRLDVRSSESVQAIARWLQNEFGAVDILVNNAGVSFGPTGITVSYENAKAMVDTNYSGVKNVTEALLPLLGASRIGARIVNNSSRMGLYDRLRSETLKKTFEDEDNYTEDLIDSLATKYLEDVRAGRWDEEGWVEGKPAKGPMYSESKMFMNAYAITLAKSLSRSQVDEGSRQVLVATFCPGVTRTDMLESSIRNGWKPPSWETLKTPAEGADTGVWLALLPTEELVPRNGKLFAERKEYAFGWRNPGY